MFYKGIILDLDDTIYDYTNTHLASLFEVNKYIIHYFNINKDVLDQYYNSVSNSLKYELLNTASSHNRNIYFKHLCEKLDLSYENISILNDIYWNSFYENIKPNEYVVEFIKWTKSKNIKIGILSDFETEYQLVKLKKLKLLDFIDVIVTSEEVGIEKPSKQMFYTILDKMNLYKHEVIMIGDSYNKDILGAINCNIYAFHYTNSQTDYSIKNNYIEFNSFRVLYDKFNEIYIELDNLEILSKYCGERFDLVQAGGGNSSIKIDNYMFIKASGFNMTNITINNGYSVIDNYKLKNDIIKNAIENDITEYNIIGKNRASIETYMHSILQTYTIHLHPIQVNKILISKNARQIIKELFPEALIIDYYTPGIKVCNEILKTYNNENYNNENLIFLINHGIVVTSNNLQELYTIIEKVIETCEVYLKVNIDIINYNINYNINYSKYKIVNKISNIMQTITGDKFVSYLCEDIIITNYLLEKKHLFEEGITFPDTLIYCGVSVIFINGQDIESTKNIENIKFHINKNSDIPKIIVYNDLIYITSINLNKCRDIECVLKSNLLILDSKFEKNYLDKSEITYLNNWDAEKYRKLI